MDRHTNWRNIQADTAGYTHAESNRKQQSIKEQNVTMMKKLTIITILLIFTVSALLSGCKNGNSPVAPTNEDNPPEITTGTLEAIITTKGSDKDTEGYTLTVGNSNSMLTDTSDTLYLSNLEEGSHRLELSELATNCSAGMDNPREVSITAGDTTSTTFEVICREVLNNQIVFTSDRDGDFELFVMNADGSNPRQLTDNTLPDREPVISPGGTRIAFRRLVSSQSEIFIINADGSGEQRLIDGSGPQWSPDGKQILLKRNSDLYIINVDGTGLMQVTDPPGTASDIFYGWSPDGEQIVFRRSPFLYVINPDGTGLQQLTADSNSTDFFPEWSPDGKRIAFSRLTSGDQFELYLINADGTGVQQLTDNSVDDLYPSWSPDGSRILFLRGTYSDGDYFVMNTDGTSVIEVTEAVSGTTDSDWSPDGQEIIYPFRANDGNLEIFKIKTDGIGFPINLTANFSTDSAPSWSPVQ